MDSAPDGLEEDADWYYLDHFNQVRGPASREVVLTIIHEYGDVRVCCRGMADWAPASALGEFDEALEAEAALEEEKEQARAGRFASGFIQTRTLDELLGLCKGLLADGVVVESEAVALEEWSRGNPHLVDTWPANVLAARLRTTFADGLVTEEELGELRALLEKIVGGPPEANLAHRYASTLPLDDPPPAVIFPNRSFCCTGRFVLGTRKRCELEISRRGGYPKKDVYQETDYLVVGTFATEAWAHGAFGRKVQTAMELRAAGTGIKIISEEHWTRFLV